MYNFKKLPLALLFLAFTLFFTSSCGTEGDDTTQINFDRPALLQNLGNNLIAIRYQELELEINALDEAVTNFAATPNTNNLAQIGIAFQNTYFQWQYCSLFDFGPAETVGLRSAVNTFPTDIEKINANITSGTYNLEIADNIDARGLPALDYLLFGIAATEAETVELYTSDALAENRLAYLQAITTDLKINMLTVINEWKATGSYLATFENAAGTDVGSSLGQLVNQLNQDFEFLKNVQIGIPLGKKTLGEALPEKVEAFYKNDISVDLAIEHLQAIEDVYFGTTHEGIDSIGLDDYLTELGTQHQSSGGLLATAIADQFTAAKNALSVVPSPLSEAVTTHPAVVETAYNELQKMVVLLKTDLPSALGVLITYNDNDGD